METDRIGRYRDSPRADAPNLMAGNVVMVKHSGTVPQCALAFEKLWRDAGAPAGAYTNLFVSYDQVNRMIDDPQIKGVALAGSEAGAKLITGGQRIDRPGAYMQPTILTNITPGNPTFGEDFHYF